MPFPFPHAQITSLFVMIVVGCLPVLMLSYVSNVAFAVVLNFLTVTSFVGLHEVARELENPFSNVPNDIPLNNFQAQYNEGLLNMFAGYHPDAHWEVWEREQETNEK
jgi:predicted membrane chloride channel (bestrophin family)